jgi:hypothetical protein
MLCVNSNWTADEFARNKGSVIDRPTVQLLLTVMAAALRDMLRIIDGLIETKRQQNLTPDIALNVCRRFFIEFWNRQLPEHANN